MSFEHNSIYDYFMPDFMPDEALRDIFYKNHVCEPFKRTVNAVMVDVYKSKALKNINMSFIREYFKTLYPVENAVKFGQYLSSIIPKRPALFSQEVATRIHGDLDNYNSQNDNLLIKEVINIAKCEIDKITFLQGIISLDFFYQQIDNNSNLSQQKYCYYNGNEMFALLRRNQITSLMLSIYTFFETYDSRIPLILQCINASKLFCLDSNNRCVDDRLLTYSKNFNDSFSMMFYEELVQMILKEKIFFTKIQILMMSLYYVIHLEIVYIMWLMK